METRTAPRQQRSRDKYQRVLAATAQLLEELPYEVIGTKVIASRAGVSVGSLYRFFVDKQAIIDALAQHWLDRLVEVMDEQLADPPDDPVELVERLVDAYTEFWRAEPGFRKVWFGTMFRLLPGAGHSNDVQLNDRLYAVLTGHYGQPPDPALRHRLGVVVDVTEHLLNLAFKDDPDGDPVLLAELKVLVTRYLGLRPVPPRTPGPVR
jgi:AcrR family transcriptional regulator